MGEIGSREWNNEMFQKHATPYRGIAGHIEERRIRAIIQVIKKYRKSEDIAILEIGCEAGNLLYACKQNLSPCSLFGIDISDDSLEVAKGKLGPETTFIRHDITEPFSADKSYDFILCSETLEHVPDYQSAVRNIRSIMTENTIFIVTVPLEKLKNQLKAFFLKIGVFNLLFKGIEKGLSEWHVNDFSKDQFNSMIGEHFAIVSYRNILNMHQLIVARKK